MEKINNFINCLNVLKQANFDLANKDEIYRTGIIGQFDLTFELSWKALQAVIRLHGTENFGAGSPREVLKQAFKIGFISDSEVWLIMLNKRNVSVHIYSEEDVDEIILLIRDSFIPTFEELAKTLKSKFDEIQNNVL